jgi:YbbR domain-containing protein
MLLAPLRWLGRNLTTLLLAFILAVVVWVSAVLTADPNEERIYNRTVTLVGQDSNLMLTSSPPGQVRITIRAPRSILSEITNNASLVQAWVDLSGVGSGPHTLPVQVKADATPVRVIKIEPQTYDINLETIISKSFPVQLSINGDPAIGYRRGTVEINPASVTVSGPESLVNNVQQVIGSLDIAGASETIQTTVALQPVDSNGNVVEEVTLSPRLVNVTQPINLLGGFRTVVVKVVPVGQLASGYRLTHISVSPPTVTVFSSNPQLVDQLPGYVETQPLDLSGLSDDVDIRMDLNLPSGISLVGEQSVLVQVGVAAIEGSLTVTLPLEPLGQAPGFDINISPRLVDVIVSGPLPVLDSLSSSSFRAVVDITGLEEGTYQINPVVDLVPDQVQVQDILPDTVEVTIQVASSTPTPAGTVIAPTTSVTATP